MKLGDQGANQLQRQQHEALKTCSSPFTQECPVPFHFPMVRHRTLRTYLTTACRLTNSRSPIAFLHPVMSSIPPGESTDLWMLENAAGFHQRTSSLVRGPLRLGIRVH
jgi:hypothetical protein